MMADLGATVIKVEAPGGDFWRRSAMPLQPGQGRRWGSYFDNHNRGKQSVVLDIATPSGLRALRALLAGADVFITNVRRAALARKGLDYEQLASEHPRLIYAHLTVKQFSGSISHVVIFCKMRGAAMADSRIRRRIASMYEPY